MLKKPKNSYPWLGHGVLLLVLWAVLSEGVMNKLPFAALIIAASLILDNRLHSRAIHVTLSGLGVARFVPYFVYHSVRAGTQVALLAFAPKLILKTQVVEINLRMEAPPAQAFYAMVMGLFPGTLCMRLGGGRLLVHMLNRTPDTDWELEVLEKRSAEMFGHR
jgi:multicomponent Na+:H+ antiporter subunit E